jgi:hypothetical protein
MGPEAGARIVEDRATRAWLGVDGIVCFWLRPGADYVLSDAKASLATTRALAPTLPAKVLVDSNGVRTATREARHYWETDAARGVISAMALLVGSPTSRIIASFVLRLVRPDFTVKVFTDEAEARRWLLGGT